MTTYKYGFMVNTMTIRAEMADLTSEELSQQLAMALGEQAGPISEGMANTPGGPSEIVSHNITRIGQHLVLTLLTRQPQQDATPQTKGDHS